MSLVEPAKILLVTDQKDEGRIAEILLHHSYTVAKAGSSESLAKVKSFLPDLILLDSTGLQCQALIAGLRADSALSQIPLILIAGDSDEIEMAALQAGVTDFLRKPVREAEITARVRTLLELKLARDEKSRADSRLGGAVSERTEMLERALRGQGALLSEAQEARRVWEATFNAMADAIVITDIDGQITLANKAATEIFHQPPEELLGQSCQALLTGGITCPHKIPPQEQSSNGREVLSRTGDRMLNIRARSFVDARGQIAGFVHVIRDVTRERVLERQLMQAERMSLAGLLVSAVAHEAATPLSVISNIAEMLLMDVESGSIAEAELNKIVTQARRVAEMMRSILDFVRQRPAQFGAVNLVQLARETLGLLEYELRKARIRASVESSPTAPAVWGDTAQLQQVLLNLITNSIQAMKDGGQLRVRIAGSAGPPDSGPSALLIVEDTGPGIAPEAMERLFDFFFTTKMAEGGTGLGLAISRQIVQGHGGAITAENLPGAGARFIVRLPVAISEDSNSQGKRTSLISAGRAESS